MAMTEVDRNEVTVATVAEATPAPPPPADWGAALGAAMALALLGTVVKSLPGMLRRR